MSYSIVLKNFSRSIKIAIAIFSLFIFFVEYISFAKVSKDSFFSKKLLLNSK